MTAPLSHLHRVVRNSFRIAQPAWPLHAEKEAGTTTVTEERGTYKLDHDNPDRGIDGVERIGDILRQLIHERGWPPPPGATRANGNRPRAKDDPSHGDA